MRGARQRPANRPRWPELIDHPDHRRWDGVRSLGGTGTGSEGPCGERTRQTEEAHGTRALAFETSGEGLHNHEDALRGNGL